jgi:hypothetical protein
VSEHRSRAAWGRAQEEVAEAKAKAVADLLATGMGAGEVAGLLGVPERALRALRTAAVRRGEKASGGEAVARVDNRGGQQ